MKPSNNYSNLTEHNLLTPNQTNTVITVRQAREGLASIIIMLVVLCNKVIISDI